jgi:iron complex outermembrane recepter protein
MPMRTRLTTKSAALVALTLTVFTNQLFAQEQSRNLNISPQSLSSGLKALASQAHLQIVSDGSALQGKHTQGIKGTYTNREAIGKLLAGTGLVYTFTANDAVAVRPAQEQQNRAYPTALMGTTLGKVTVEADAYDPDWQTDPYNTDYVLPNATAGTKTNTPVMETPLNVQVISKQVLKDQQVISLDKALRNISGVTTVKNDSGLGGLRGQQLYLRGFQTTTLFRNGFRMDAGGDGAGNGGFGINQQFANVESIEVLKGPAAILYGRVEPGGMVNVTTKQPRATPYYSLNQQFGSYDLYRTSIDATGPLTKGDTLLYRMNASFQSNNSFRDLVGNENIFLAPIIKWNISPRTQATLEMEYQHDLSSLDPQILPFKNNRIIDIPHNRNLGERNPLEAENIFVGFNWSHQFNEDWAVKHQVAFKRQDFNQGISTTFFNIVGNQVNRFVSAGNSLNDTIAANLDLTGHFKTWGLEHTLLFGGDYYGFENNGNVSFGALDADFNPLSNINLNNPIHPGPNLVIDPNNALNSKNSSNTDNYGLYLQDQIKLPYDIHVMGGLRYQYVHSTSISGSIPNASQTDDAVTPRVGLLWQPQKWLSLYSNYAESFGANSGSRAIGGKPLPPQSAQQWEVGIKGEFFDGRLRATLAYFHLTKQNIATSDTVNQNNPSCVRIGGCSIAVGEVRSRGPELDIQGEILPGWNVIATYANQDVRVTKGDSGGGAIGTTFSVGDRLPFIPRNIGSLWTTYEVQQGDLKGFKIGGGVTLQDGVVGQYFQTTTKSTGYGLVSLLAGYSFEVGKSKVTAQLNIDNLLDKTYFTNAVPLKDDGAGINDGYSSVTFSTPRSFMGSINVEY